MIEQFENTSERSVSREPAQPLESSQLDEALRKVENAAVEGDPHAVEEAQELLSHEVAKHPELPLEQRKLVEATFADAVRTLKKQFGKGVKTAMVAAFSMLTITGTAQEKGSIEKVPQGTESLENLKGAFSDEYYTTVDGNLRRFHNPSAGLQTDAGTEDVRYSFGATVSPFTTHEGMKDSTRIPQSLGETDFFTNYANALSQTEKVIVDPATGNRYYENESRENLSTGVPYEGEQHWNVKRFVIEPHYRNFEIPKEEARENALFDAYRNFLFLEKGNRETAWEKAEAFMKESVDPVVNSFSERWFEENEDQLSGQEHDLAREGRFVGSLNLYDKEGNTDFVQKVLVHNRASSEGLEPGRVYGRKEILGVLTDYNQHFRNLSLEQAALVAEKSIVDEEAKISDEIKRLESKGLSETELAQSRARLEALRFAAE